MEYCTNYLILGVNQIVSCINLNTCKKNFDLKDGWGVKLNFFLLEIIDRNYQVTHALINLNT